MKRLFSIPFRWSSVFFFLCGYTLGVEGESVSRITGNLVCMCGTCASLLVRNCACGFAVEMTGEVKELLAEEKTEAEIYAVFEGRYGSVVLAAPKPEGFNMLVWILPFLSLVLGACVVVVAVTKLRNNKENPKVVLTEIDDKYRRLLDRELRE